jgi:hypothetical protein
MVSHRDIEQCAYLHQPLSDLVIFRTRRGVAARVVVGDDNAAGAVPDGLPKHFPRAHKAGAQRTNVDFRDPHDVVLRIEQDRDEVFPLLYPKMLNVRERVLRIRYPVPLAGSDGRGSPAEFDERHGSQDFERFEAGHRVQIGVTGLA